MTEAAMLPDLIRGRVTAPRPQGLRRGRLVRPLVAPGAPRLALVVAPAGSGKSTLLAHVAEAAAGPVAWLTLDSGTGETGHLLAHLRAAFAPVLPGTAPHWPGVDAAVADLERTLTAPLLLVLDDLHTAPPGVVREVVGLFIDYQPELLRIVLGSRRTPDLDIPRRRLAGSMLEVDADALRFRTWEVDELFRQCHQVQLRPKEVSALTQRTAGWAAGLQLFHLATRRQPPSSRAALLARGGPGSRLTQEYLARHVLDRVEAPVRSFLIRTSVLDELTAQRCDALLGTSDATRQLTELERNGIFTFADGDTDVYRYHDVLRAHLLDELSARFGVEHARALHHRAAMLLEREGALAEAIRSYCRAEDWDDIRRLLATGGASLAREPGTWIDLLPVSIRDHDPWALLALARRLLAEGSLDRAAQMYQRAVDRLEPHGAGRAAAAELRQLQAWLTPTLGVVTDWVHVARAVLVDPRKHRQRAGRGGSGAATESGRGVADELLRGFADLVSGELAGANDTFTTLSRDGDLSVPAETAALLGRAVGLNLAGSADTDAEEATLVREQAAAAVKQFGVPVIERLVHGLQAIVAGDRAAIDYLLGECRRADDRWGAAALRLLAEISALPGGSASPELLESVEQEFQELAAPALAAWAGAGAALAAAMAGRPLPAARVTAAELAARAVGPLPYALALLAVAAGEPSGAGKPSAASRIEATALQIGERCGAGRLTRRIARRLRAHAGTVAGPMAYAVESPAAPAAGPTAASLRLRCLGGFAIELAGEPVDLGPIRPRYRELLRLLSLHANRVVHREHLIEWLWPGRDPERGQHSLQVAISDLRKLLEPAAPRGEWTRLRREDAGYRLVLDAENDCDVRRFERHLRDARTAAGNGDEGAAVAHLEAAIATYAGELLPDDGPAEWVVAERDRLRNGLVEACERLAGVRAARGAHAEAVRVARHGLSHDRYRDGLWQRLIGSLQASGNPAAAAAATTAYEQVLAEMDMP
ncbi:MAG TPA: BTAD domain-containing putative transcriptional regulator [Pilimelia sp.]|nr:BTAD domain-containing putative transcriptional regulator [Pilimelia sp.]